MPCIMPLMCHDVQVLAAAAAEPSAPIPHSRDRQLDAGQSVSLASDSATGNLRTATAAAVASATASVPAAIAAE
jgi:hypothetical protein